MTKPGFDNRSHIFYFLKDSCKCPLSEIVRGKNLTKLEYVIYVPFHKCKNIIFPYSLVIHSNISYIFRSGFGKIKKKSDANFYLKVNYYVHITDVILRCLVWH